jgi:hypothetical protein
MIAMWNKDWMSGFDSGKGKLWDFSLRHRIQTGTGARLASYSMATRGSFPRGVLTNTRRNVVPMLRMRGAITLLLQYVFKEWCLAEDMGNFTSTWRVSDTFL